MTSQQQDELLKSIGNLFDGSVIPSSMAQLLQRLADDPESQAMYFEFVELDTELEWLFETRARLDLFEGAERPSIPIEKAVQPTSRVDVAKILPLPSAVLPKSRSIFSASAMRYVALVALCLYGSFAIVAWNLRPDMLPTFANDDSAVAVIGDTRDVQWSKKNPAKLTKSPIHSGEQLKIDSGAIELELETGAKLVVEGPADWSVDGKNSVSLRAGKLLATVPTQAIGFTVLTPTAKIVDLGTEFGVEVDDSRNTNIYVLKGDVLAERPGQAVAQNQEIRLSAGRAVRLTTSGEVIQRTESESAAIANEFSSLLRKKESDTQDNSAKTRDRNDQHARLLSLFPFDGSPTNIILGAADGTLEGVDGPNHLPRYVSGKIGAKGLDFDGVDDRVNATVYGYPKASAQSRHSNGLEKGSAAFWIKTTDSKEGYVLSNFEGNTALSLIANYGNTPGQLLVYLRTSSLSILQMHLAEPENVWRNGDWHHVVMTWNVTTGAAGTGSGAFWIDGVPKPVSFMFNSITSNDKFDAWRSDSLIGAGGSRHYFAGSLDDLGVWNSQLSEAEARTLYNLGNDPVLNYNARDIQILLDVFAKGPGAKGRTSDGRTWKYATGLTGNIAEVIDAHTAVVFDADNHTGVQITSARGDKVKQFANATMSLIRDQKQTSISCFLKGRMTMKSFRLLIAVALLTVATNANAVLIGNDPNEVGWDQPRDGVNVLAIELDNPFPQAGTVSSYSFFVGNSGNGNGTGPIAALILRPLGSDQYQVIFDGGTLAGSSFSTGVHSTSISSFAVQAGDLIGYWGAALSYDVDPAADPVFLGPAGSGLNAAKPSGTFTAPSSGVYNQHTEMREYALAFEFTAVPEPGAFALSSCGLFGLLAYTRRRRNVN